MFERIKSITVKEFRQIFRDPRMKMILFVMPIFQLVVFGFAVSTDVRKVETGVYDLDNSPDSRELVRELGYSKYFVIKKYISTDEEQKNWIDTSKVKVVLRINRGFAEDIKGSKTANLQLIVDGTDSNIAGVVLGYANQIIERYSDRIGKGRVEALLQKVGGVQPRLTAEARQVGTVEMRNRAWFNENLESRNFYLPGIIALLLLIITMLLTAMAIVKEKEVGTIEQLIVSPIRSWELIIGKLIPFAIIGFADIILITTIAVFLFNVPIRGSIVLLLAASSLYLLNTLGLGLFISTVAKTLQEAVMSTFFIIQPAVLLSGFVFPIANMPKVIQYITYINPLRYFLLIIRGIFLKGSGIDILWPQMLVLLVMGAGILTVSSLKFHKRLG